MTDEYDYSAYDDGPGDNILAQISHAAEEQVRLENEVAELERKLKAKTVELKVVSENTLPELMKAAGQERCKTLDGHEVVLDQNIFASIKEINKSQALEWLRANGHEAIIKNEFKVQFPMNSDESSAEFSDYLAEQIAGVADVAHKVSVHPSTLSSFVREELNAGNDIPMELLGVTQRHVTKIK